MLTTLYKGPFGLRSNIRLVSCSPGLVVVVSNNWHPTNTFILFKDKESSGRKLSSSKNSVIENMLGGSGLVKHEIWNNLILFLQSGEILLANLLSLQSTFIPTNFASVSSASLLPPSRWQQFQLSYFYWHWLWLCRCCRPWPRWLWLPATPPPPPPPTWPPPSRRSESVVRERV